MLALRMRQKDRGVLLPSSGHTRTASAESAGARMPDATSTPLDGVRRTRRPLAVPIDIRTC